MADNVTLFWVLVVGILAYLYVDVRIESMRKDMMAQMYMFERAFQHAVRTGQGKLNVLEERQPPQQRQVIDHWAVTERPTHEETKFIDDIVPTRAELEAAGIRGLTAPPWGAERSQETGLRDITGYTGPFGDMYAPFPRV